MRKSKRLFSVCFINAKKENFFSFWSLSIQRLCEYFLSLFWNPLRHKWGSCDCYLQSWGQKNCCKLFPNPVFEQVLLMLLRLSICLQISCKIWLLLFECFWDIRALFPSCFQHNALPAVLPVFIVHLAFKFSKWISTMASFVFNFEKIVTRCAIALSGFSRSASRFVCNKTSLLFMDFFLNKGLSKALKSFWNFQEGPNSNFQQHFSFLESKNCILKTAKLFWNIELF